MMMQQQCSCSKSGDREDRRRAASPAGAFHAGWNAEDGSEDPLSDDFEIEAACTVALCMKPEEEWEWDTASDLIPDKVFELSGLNNSIATMIDEDDDEDWANFMMVGSVVMRAGTGKQCRLHVHYVQCGERWSALQ